MKKKSNNQKDQRDKKTLSKKNFPKVPKICHIITGLERGGAERFLFNLLTDTNLNKETNNIVISLMSEGYYGPLLKKKKISLSCLNMNRGQINISSVIKLHQILKKTKPDIVQGWMYHGNLAALLGTYINKKVKLSWNIRLSLETYSEMKFKTRLAIKLGAMFSKKANSIIYNSKRSLNLLRQFGFSFNPVKAPFAGAVFSNEIIKPPRAWAEEIYNVIQWNKFEGGHFAANENPEILAKDVIDFVKKLKL